MKAYVVIRVKASDPTLLKPYQQRAPSIIEKYNGKILARGGKTLMLEGSEEVGRIIIIEFPSLEKAEEFYYSNEYAEAKALREDVASFEIIATEAIG